MRATVVLLAALLVAAAVADACDPGEGTPLCDTCARGWFSDGTAPCAPCVAGTYGPAAHLHACTPCPAGSYQPGLAKTQCIPCAAGASSPTGAVECEACANNTYAPVPAMPSCIACPNGSVADAGRERCAPCETGFVATAGVCAPCPAHATTDYEARQCPTECDSVTPPACEECPVREECAECVECEQREEGVATCSGGSSSIASWAVGCIGVAVAYMATRYYYKRGRSSRGRPAALDGPGLDSGDETGTPNTDA